MSLRSQNYHTVIRFRLRNLAFIHNTCDFSRTRGSVSYVERKKENKTDDSESHGTVSVQGPSSWSGLASGLGGSPVCRLWLSIVTGAAAFSRGVKEAVRLNPTVHSSVADASRVQHSRRLQACLCVWTLSLKGPKPQPFTHRLIGLLLRRRCFLSGSSVRPKISPLSPTCGNRWYLPSETSPLGGLVQWVGAGLPQLKTKFSLASFLFKIRLTCRL